MSHTTTPPVIDPPPLPIGIAPPFVARSTPRIATTAVVARPVAPAPTLDQSITTLFRTGAGSVWPNQRFVVPVFDLIKRTNNGGSLSLSEDMMRRFVTAMCYAEKEQQLATLDVNGWKIKQFMALTESFQMQLIDKIWDACTLSQSYTVDLASMTEPDGEVTLMDTALPSFVVPATGAGRQPTPFVRNTTVARPFKTLGAAFRVDGSAAVGAAFDSVGRVAREGLTAQVLNSWFMLNVRRMTVDGTTVARNTDRLRYYKVSNDLFNETGVCVARSLLGATAFPERDTKGDVCLWAANVTGLLGFDTEALQGAKRWRPGEKAYRIIPPGQVIGWVRMERKGVPQISKGRRTWDGGGWIFNIAKGAKWTYLTVPSAPVKQYVEAALDAWATGTDTIVPDDFDFAMTMG